MRILAIRGENLASLAEQFAIEFEEEPLRSAGLFAITGETGAGKSTILDALCLALYDEIPRLFAPGDAERTPDPSGETLASGDQRAILRRGAGRGFAEADFIARDGKRYRARCDLMRARGKVSGKLQQRTRALWRIDESGEKIEALESGVGPVNRRIIELTDLTFDQFRRTALLAQGDFDAFLRADAKERADLLEKITGAEIYGVLSRRAFERWGEAKNKVDALQAKLSDVGAMAAKERADIDAEMSEIGTQRTALALEKDDTLALLAQIDALSRARERLAQAEAARVGAEDAWAALAAWRALLADLARAEALRGPRDAMCRAEAGCQGRRDAASDAKEKAEAARRAMEAARERAQDAAKALESAEGEIARLSPLWDAARELDMRIEAQTQEAERAAGNQAAARQRLEEKREAAKAAEAEKTAAVKTRDDLRAARDELASAQPLSERWNEVEDWLTKRAQFVKEKHEAANALQRAVADAKRADAARAAFDAADRKDRDALLLIATHLREREAALAALDVAAATRRGEEVAQAHDVLKAMAHCAASHDAAQEKAAGARADLARFEAEAVALAGEMAARRASRDELAAKGEEAERLAELADAVADPHALKLRATLEENAPCPVCGALAHPFAHSAGAAAELVKTLRAGRDAARRALAKLDGDISTIAQRQASARALKDDAARRLDEALAALALAARDYAAHRAQLAGGDAPEDIAGAGETLAALLMNASEERSALQKIASTAFDLQGERDRLRKRLDDTREAMEARATAREEADALLRTAGESCARNDEKLANAGERIASLDRSLSEFLVLCDLTPDDLDRDASSARRRLEEAAARFRSARESVEHAEMRLSEIVHVTVRLSAEVDGAQEQAKTATDDYAARALALANVRERRSAMLGGEATATHCARHERTRDEARKAHEAAQAARAECDKVCAACDEASAVAQSEVELAMQAFEKAREAFADALSASGLDEEKAAALLAISAETAEKMRQAVEKAQAELRDAQTAVEQRGADLREAEAKGRPEAPRAALEARVAELTQALNRLVERFGALRERLLADDAARERAASLTAEIEIASAARKVWDEVNAAIGSREGDKFRRFAQSVTLEQLVALANQRLALLSPRYRLERAGEMGSLGLQIVDRDLGEERRSTRSLSGGERFLASLALALALAGLEGRDSFVDTLFIDEGFGALDSATLDVAIDALENLQGQGRKVGVISHVESMQARIATKICVERRGGGVSRVRLRAPGFRD